MCSSDLAGVPVRVTSPSRELFPAHEGRPAITKMDLIEFYLELSSPLLTALRERPTVLKRFRDGITKEPFFQKRVPAGRPEWLQTVELAFPSGRTATELVPTDAAHLVWATNLANIDFNPHPVRRDDLDHPDELRIDLDPQPGVPWSQVREVAMVVKEVLEEQGLRGWPKTSGSRGIHIYVRIRREWDFLAVRRAALAVSREVERRMPGRATSKWWKEEREGVFLDYNQNARDRTIASAWSVRPVPEARVSCGLAWEEVPDVEPGDLTFFTVRERLASGGDPIGGIDDAAGSLDGLLELSRRDEEEGLGDAPWPPNFPKMPGEPKRVQPSRARPEAD